MQKETDKDTLRPEYALSDLKGAVRGKYYEQVSQGTNLVKLSPELAKVFPNDKAVNDALLSLVQLMKHLPSLPVPPPAGTTRKSRAPR